MNRKVLVLVLAICTLGGLAYWYMYGFGDPRTISYRGRDYVLSSGDQQVIFKNLNNQKFGKIKSTKTFVKCCEIYTSEAGIGSDYVPTVIFLKKSDELFDVYSLVGGP